MVQCLGFGAFTAETWVQSLVRKLRSHRPHSTAKIKFLLKNIVSKPPLPVRNIRAQTGSGLSVGVCVARWVAPVMLRRDGYRGQGASQKLLDVVAQWEAGL